MKLKKATIDLVCEIENIIANECYNPNSFDGWTLVEGCSYRYPVCYRGKDGLTYKVRYMINNMDKERIKTIRYQFGSNHLYIGNAIVKILERLEQKYGLDFDELTKHSK